MNEYPIESVLKGKHLYILYSKLVLYPYDKVSKHYCVFELPVSVDSSDVCGNEQFHTI